MLRGRARARPAAARHSGRAAAERCSSSAKTWSPSAARCSAREPAGRARGRRHQGRLAARSRTACRPTPARARARAIQPRPARAPRSSPCRALFEEAQAATLTGPGRQLGGPVPQLRAPRHARLAADRRGDRADRTRLARRPRASRAKTSALYIESVYDAHFTLAQIGKQLRAGYQQARRRRPRSAPRSRRREVDALARRLLRSERPAAPARAACELGS